MFQRVATIIPAALVLSVATLAQTDTHTQSREKYSSRISKKQMMTIGGCLVSESDYRRTHGRGKGYFGGAGLGDEFVLVGATTMTPSSAVAAANGDAASAAPSTSARNCTADMGGQAYRLTGALEKKLKPMVGQWIEVTGRFDHKHDARIAAGEKHAELPGEIRIRSFRPMPASNLIASATTTESSAAESSQSTLNNSASNNEASSNSQTLDRAESTNAQNTPNQSATVGTSGTSQLPKTASRVPLVGLLGFMSVSVGALMMLVRRRAW